MLFKMNPGFNCTGQMADSVYGVVWGEWFADVNIVNIVSHGGRQAQTTDNEHYYIFSICNLNAQRYCDEILRPIVIHHHHLMFQHDNARPHVARICTQFLEAENVPVLPWPAYSPDMSPIEHVWDALVQSVRQRVPVHANIQQLRTAIEEEWDNIPQATDGLIKSRCMRQMVDIPGTDWFSDPHPYFFKGISDQQMNICIPTHVKSID
jgi:transposase